METTTEEMMKTAFALVEGSNELLSTCSPFRLDPSVSQRFGSDNRVVSILAGLLAGAEFLEAEFNGFVRGSRPVEDLSVSTLLEGATIGLCPPELVAAYYVAAGVHPVWGLRAQSEPESQVGKLTREYVASLVAGQSIVESIKAYRESLQRLPKESYLYLIRDSLEELESLKCRLR